METFATRLMDGADLLDSIDGICKQQNIEAGVILSGVGGLKESRIRVPVINGDVKYINPAMVEIDSLHGTVSANGSHLHIMVSDADGRVHGGHVKQGCVVWMTCELVIGILGNVTFTREPDQQTGYEELVVSE